MPSQYSITFNQFFKNRDLAQKFLSAYWSGIDNMPEQLRIRVGMDNSLFLSLSANDKLFDSSNPTKTQYISDEITSKSSLFQFSGSNPEDVTAAAALVLRKCVPFIDMASLSIKVMFPPNMSFDEEKTWMENAQTLMNKNGFLMTPVVYHVPKNEGLTTRSWFAAFPDNIDSYRFFHYCYLAGAFNRKDDSPLPPLNNIIKRAATPTQPPPRKAIILEFTKPK